MRYLTLADLKLALINLLNERKSELSVSDTGKLYTKQLHAKLDEIQKLPEALTGGRPLAHELGTTDIEHDAIGESLYYYAEAIIRNPLLPIPVKRSAQRVRDTFVPRLDVLRESYADQAAAALENREELTRLENDLKALPVPLGGTMLEWATAFVERGETMHRLLSDRSLSAGAAPLPEHAIKLRASTIGVLTRFRAALADELDVSPDLPRDLDTKLFSYFDELQDMRANAKRAAKTENAAATPLPPPVSVPTDEE